MVRSPLIWAMITLCAAFNLAGAQVTAPLTREFRHNKFHYWNESGNLLVSATLQNNRLDTLRNIVGDPRVALLFLIPGWNETLRINGRAHLTTDPGLLEAFVEKGKLPVSAVVVRIDTMYFQCARALKRAAFWDDASQVDPANLPTAGKLVKSVMQSFDATGYDAALQERQAKTLY